tara:strand:- start:148 stop:387 length:240 start_codon:yes stop_codon:yes gene_type:complete
MKPKYLVYILTAIIVAFVLRGYFAAEEVQLILQAAEQGETEHINCPAACESIDNFQTHLILSAVFAVSIATCCRLKAPK